VAITYLESHSARKALHTVRTHAPSVPVLVRTQTDRDLDALRAAGATEVVPESLEGSLMLAGHALALMGVPMRRVIRVVQEQREARYGLLRGFFRGADDVSDDELAHERLATFTIPARLAGQHLTQVLRDSGGELRAISLRRRSGQTVHADEDTQVDSGDTVVLSGKVEALARAELALAG
jgi:CPA2 family monovalent cation:H+ antiporter-2